MSSSNQAILKLGFKSNQGVDTNGRLTALQCYNRFLNMVAVTATSILCSV